MTTEPEEEEEETVLVCMPIALVENPTANATITYCELCQNEVWIAASSRDLMSTTPMPIWCTDCAQAKLRTREVEAASFGTAPGAKDSLVQVVAELNAKLKRKDN